MPRVHRSVRAVPWICAATATAALAQQEAWRVAGLDRSESLGHAVTLVDDLDGDGTRDLLVGSPGTRGTAPAGRALLLSGRDLALLRELAGPIGESFGRSVAAIGDVDGDAIGDHFVGSDGPAAIGGIGRIYSGASGALLATFTSPDPAARFGAAAVGLGDVDGDGVADFAIGAPDELVGATRVGVVRIYSGASGSELRRFDGSDATAALGGTDRIANVGDLDGDGRADLGVLDAEPGTAAPYSVARIYSSATGVELLAARFDTGLRSEYLLSSIAGAGDVDGDAVADLVVGGLPLDPKARGGRAFVLSGAGTGTLLGIDLGSSPEWFVVALGGDVDGDTNDDLVISTTVPSPFAPEPLLSLHRLSDGASIGAFSATPSSTAGRAFAAGADFDGDGQPDIAIGESTMHLDGDPAGELRLQRWPNGTLIARRAGEPADRRFRGAVAQMGDFDGDGTSDFAAADPGTAQLSSDQLRIHSGRDGRELRVHSIAATPDGDLVALPDLDGDGLDDLAIGIDLTSRFPAVELRSSATGALLRRWNGSGNAVDRFGEQLAVGVQPNGATHLAIGAPRSSAGVSNGGEVQVVDAQSGVLVFRKLGAWFGEQLGQDVAFLGDVNGDATGDWALGAPKHGGAGKEAGRVLVVSGVAGGTLQSLLGAGALDWFGAAVAGVGDVDGDLIPDFAATALQTGGSFEGDVRIYRGGAWTLLGNVRGLGRDDRFGERLEALADVNGDGRAEWAVRGLTPPRVELRSSSNGSLLATLPATAASVRFATPAAHATGSANGDRFADLLLADVAEQAGLSAAWLIVLDDLLLQFEPPVALAGATQFARLRGGPAGNACGLLLLDIGGVPVNQWLGLGSFDPQGAFALSDTVPPGLAGLTLTVQGFGVGFRGRVVDSPAQVLQFQ
ncbi:MAG: FG-GAP repeat protein [Planctomycetes bacterium]|nr:FG-GAP repeat protein [Planctomycetota bacterium]